MFEKEAEEYTDKHVIAIRQVSETDLYYAFKDGAARMGRMNWRMILDFLRVLLISVLLIFFVIASVALLAWLIKEVLI